MAALGAEVVQGDLDDAASFDARSPVPGASTRFRTPGKRASRRRRSRERLAKLAREAGVQHFVYASVASAERETGIPHFENKARVEQTVKELGFPSHVVVRPVFFMENLISPLVSRGGRQAQIGLRPDVRCR